MIQLIKLKIMLFEAAKVRNFQNLSTFAGQNRTRSLMDKIKDSGSLAQGSIPCGFTNKKWLLDGAIFLYPNNPFGIFLDMFFTNHQATERLFGGVRSLVVFIH